MSPRNRRVTLMLVAVIGLFVVCVTPDAVMSTVFGLGYHDENYLVRSVREITDFLLTVNSAGNFVVYCAFNRVFRNRLRALVTADCRRQRRRRTEARRPRNLGNNGSDVDEVDDPIRPLSQRNSRLPAVRHSLDTNGHDFDVICTNSNGNVSIELVSINRQNIDVDQRTLTTSAKQSPSPKSYKSRAEIE